MSFNLGSIYTEFRLKLAGLASDVEKAKQMINDSNEEVKKIVEQGSKEAAKVYQQQERQWKETGRSITEVGKVITAVGVASSLGIGKVVKEAAAWESAFAGVKKTVDEVENANGEVVLSYDQLERSLRDMALSLPTTATEIAGVAEAAGQLGISSEKITTFTETMIAMGVSTDMSSTEAATSFARFANIVGMSEDDFGRAGSSVVQLGNNFATTESEIMNMSLRLAGAGNQIGLSEADIFGLSAALSSVGIRAEMGGSAFSKAMTNMQLATTLGLEPANELMEKTGMSLRDLELMSANSSKDFKELAGSIGMTAEEVNNIIKHGNGLQDFAHIAGMTGEQFKEAFEKDAVGAIGAFLEGLGNAEEKGTTAINLLDEMGVKEVRLRDSLLRAGGAQHLFADAVEQSNQAWERNSALTDEANKRYETFDSQLVLFKNKLTEIMIVVGGPFKDALRDLMQAADPLLQWALDLANKFASLDEQSRKNIATSTILASSFAAIGGPLMMLGGKAFPHVMSASNALTLKAFPGLIAANKKVVGATLSNTLGLNKLSAGFTASTAASGATVAGMGAVAFVMAAVTAAIVAMAVAFHDNTYKVRELMSSLWQATKEAFGGMGDQIKDVLKSIKPLTDMLKGILILLGSAIWYAFAITLATIVDVLRLFVGLLSTGIHSVKAFMLVVKAGLDLLNDGPKKAGETMKEAGKEFELAGKTLVDTFNPANSVLVKTFQNMGKVKESTEDTARVFEVSKTSVDGFLTAVSRAAEDTSDRIAGATQQLQEGLVDSLDANGEALSQNTVKMLDNIVNLYELYNEKTVENQRQHAEALAAADILSGDERLEAIAAVNETYANEQLRNNAYLLAINEDYQKVLREGTWENGAELTDVQRQILEEQTELIRLELNKQNELHVASMLMRIETGKELSEQEQLTAIEVLRAAYEQRQLAMTAGEDELQKLRDMKAKATSEAEKANLQIRIDAQAEHNRELLEQTNIWGQEMLTLMMNNGEMTTQNWVTAVGKMGPLTDAQLVSVFRAFVTSTGEIDQHMGVFASILGERGGESVSKFTEAIKAGDFAGAAQYVDDSVITGIKALPPGMFKQGDAGKDDFIKALKSGDYESAGKHLVGTTEKGIMDVIPKLGDAGGAGADKFGDGMIKGKGVAKTAGSDLALSSYEGMMTPWAQRSLEAGGKSSALSAKGGFESIDASPAGYWMSQGLASGLYEGQNDVTRAAGNVAINAYNSMLRTLDVRSPSRKGKYVGDMLSQGLAGGILSSIGDVIKAAKGVSQGALDALRPAMDTEFDWSFGSDVDSKILNKRIFEGTSVVNNFHFNTPLVGVAEILDTRDILTLSQELQRGIEGKRKANGEVVPSS